MKVSKYLTIEFVAVGLVHLFFNVGMWYARVFGPWNNNYESFQITFIFLSSLIFLFYEIRYILSILIERETYLATRASRIFIAIFLSFIGASFEFYLLMSLILQFQYGGIIFVFLLGLTLYLMIAFFLAPVVFLVNEAALLLLKKVSLKLSNWMGNRDISSKNLYKPPKVLFILEALFALVLIVEFLVQVCFIILDAQGHEFVQLIKIVKFLHPILTIYLLYRAVTTVFLIIKSYKSKLQVESRLYNLMNFTLKTALVVYLYPILITAFLTYPYKFNLGSPYPVLFYIHIFLILFIITPDFGKLYLLICKGIGYLFRKSQTLNHT